MSAVDRIMRVEVSRSIRLDLYPITRPDNKNRSPYTVIINGEFYSAKRRKIVPKSYWYLSELPELVILFVATMDQVGAPIPDWLQPALEHAKKNPPKVSF